MFGCTGTRSQKGPGLAPFPQLLLLVVVVVLAVVVTARAGRAKLGAITGQGQARPCAAGRSRRVACSLGNGARGRRG